MGDSSPTIRLDEDMSTHSDVSSSTHSQYQDSTRGMLGHHGQGGLSSSQSFNMSVARNPMQSTVQSKSNQPTTAMDAASSLARFTSAFHEDEEEVDVSLRASVLTTRSEPSSTAHQPPLSTAARNETAESGVTPSSLSITTAPISMPDEEEDSLPL
jgi:hypothetical protein